MATAPLASTSDSTILASFINFVISSEITTAEDISSSIDDTIGAYVVNTIKQLYADYECHSHWLNAEQATETLDLESFVEVIDPYLPGFECLPYEKIVTWLMELKK